MTAIKHATSICASALSQVAALAILNGPLELLHAMMTQWSVRHDYLYQRLEAMGVPTPG